VFSVYVRRSGAFQQRIRTNRVRLRVYNCKTFQRLLKGTTSQSIQTREWCTTTPIRKESIFLICRRSLRAINSEQTPLPYHPFPANLYDFRETISKLEKPILLSHQQFADYWPYVSHVYARSTGLHWDANGVQIEV
jgi:hypothetical protein